MYGLSVQGRNETDMSDYNGNFENKAPEGNESPNTQEPVQQNVQEPAPEAPAAAETPAPEAAPAE